MNKKRLISIICGFLAIPLVLFPVASVVVYEVIFSQRYETPDWLEFSVDEFENLQVERCELSTDYGITLAGYQYEKPQETYKGVVVVSHGLGGGHNTYMPMIDQFASNGYCVFAYDATGNDNSTGNSIRGLPQGIKDLETAISYVKEAPRYDGLPIVLFGHSWGAYSVGNVLNFYPDVEAAVIVAGFNESEDMLLHYSEKVMGGLAKATGFYVFLYEKIKFGSVYTDLTAVEGIEKSDAEILVVHSKDDETVPATYGHDTFYEAFGTEGQVDYLLYEDKGHNLLFYSDTANAYREQLNQDYAKYVAKNGGVESEALKEDFMKAHLDKKVCYEPNPELMEEIIALYDKCCA